MDAERVEIWSDVPGVLEADPRLVPTAATIPWLSYADATALARRGAKVLHPRTLEPLEDAGIPVFVGHTLRPDGPGTWIAAEPGRGRGNERRGGRHGGLTTWGRRQTTSRTTASKEKPSGP